MTRNILSALALTTVFGVSAFMPAAAAADDHDRRVYDRAHRDYHVWNSDEDRSYREYLNEHHRPYREFRRMTRKQRLAYWNWRHEHERHEQRERR